VESRGGAADAHTDEYPDADKYPNSDAHAHAVL
jgi:hypothetical protein